MTRRGHKVKLQRSHDFSLWRDPRCDRQTLCLPVLVKLWLDSESRSLSSFLPFFPLINQNKNAKILKKQSKCSSLINGSYTNHLLKLASGTITANEIFTKLKTLFFFIHWSALYFTKQVSDTSSFLWDHFIWSAVTFRQTLEWLFQEPASSVLRVRWIRCCCPLLLSSHNDSFFPSGFL